MDCDENEEIDVCLKLDIGYWFNRIVRGENICRRIEHHIQARRKVTYTVRRWLAAEASSRGHSIGIISADSILF